jgi:hypothetical protein
MRVEQMRREIKERLPSESEHIDKFTDQEVEIIYNDQNEIENAINTTNIPIASNTPHCIAQ